MRFITYNNPVGHKTIYRIVGDVMFWVASEVGHQKRKGPYPIPELSIYWTETTLEERAKLL